MAGITYGVLWYRQCPLTQAGLSLLSFGLTILQFTVLYMIYSLAKDTRKAAKRSLIVGAIGGLLSMTFIYAGVQQQHGGCHLRFYPEDASK